MEQLLELGGKSKVIFRAICDFDTANHSYKKGDIVFSDMDTEILVTEMPENRSITKGNKVLLATSKKRFGNLTINEVRVTTSLLDLFSKVVEETYSSLIIDNLFVIDNTVYATQLVDTTKSYCILNHEDIELTYNEAYNNFTFEGTLKEDVEYQLCYYSIKDNYYYSLDEGADDIPYLSFEAIITGNNNKENTKTYLFIPKVSLKKNLVLNTKVNSVAYYSLNFDIIYTEKDKMMLGL